MAITERLVIAGIFENRALAEQAVQELQKAGFTNDQIKVSVQKGDAGILDGLIGMGLSPDEAQLYDNEYRSGRTIVAVKTADRQQEAADILRLSGAYNATSHVDSGASLAEGNDQTLQLREEVLHIEKNWVQTGEIRIHKRVITEEKVFRVPVTREEVIIEHISFNGQPSAISAATTTTAATENGEGELVTLTDGKPLTILVREEQVSIQKTPMVIEEITITKKIIQEMKPITETLQKEELHVERTGNVHIQGDNVEDVLAQS
ncbi:MAG: YsnF/AvaK domain-containing protein [Ktedonobacteraceae bacterium]